MAFSGIHDILYGPLRPALHPELPAEGVHEDPAIMLYRPLLPEPFDQESLHYTYFIEADVLKEHATFIREIGEADLSEVDRRYRLTAFRREAEDLARDAETLLPKTTGDEPAVPSFVGTCIRRWLVAVLSDIALRYDQKELRLQRTYPRLFGRPVPDQPVIYCTRPGLAFRLRQQLVPGEEAAMDQIPALLLSMKNEIESGGSPLEEAELYPLFHHAENASFLIRYGAGFLEKEPDKLADATYCQEWVEGLYEDWTGDGGLEDPDLMQQLMTALAHSDNTMRPARAAFPDAPLSAAGQWHREIQQISGGPGGMPAPRTAGARQPASGKTNGSFIDYFNATFIHKSELEQALDVDRKTLKTYLENSGIQSVTLRSNQWFYRPDVEAFLEEKLES